MHYQYRTQGTCSQLIDFDLEDGIVSNVVFTGGCNGNLKAIGSLVDGMPAKEVMEKIGGITCGWKDTSCGDQLALALKTALEKEDPKEK